MKMPLVAPPGAGHFDPLTIFYVVSLVILLLGVLGGSMLALAPRHPQPRSMPNPAPPLARQVLCYGIGGLWILDGFLQAQPSLVTNLTQTISPLLPNQPAMVAFILHAGIRTWNLDPVAFDLAAMWVQIGIGTIIVVSGESRWRRWALWASIVWSAVVWGGGEAFGGSFAGGSWLSGSPGSVLFYGLAAALLLLPYPWWTKPNSQRVLRLGIAGVWWLAVAFQAWPADGWWSMAFARYVRQMAQMPQPHLISAPLFAWANSLARYPVAWNIAVIAVFLACALYWTLAKPSSMVGWSLSVLVTLASWFFGQDFGVFGGTGTDPNSAVVLLLGLIVYAVAAKHVIVSGQVPKGDLLKEGA